MRQAKLIIFLGILVGGTALLFMSANDAPSVRGRDSSVGTDALRTDGLPPGSAPAAPADASAGWGGDEVWIADVAALHATEISVAELAMRRAVRADVKAFAAQLQREHADALASVERTARSAGLRYPDTINSRDATSAFMEAAETERPDADFDEAYLDAMIQSHERALAAFRHAAEASTHAEVRALAARQLPTLEGHLARARTLGAESASR